MNIGIIGVGSNIEADKNISIMLELLKQKVEIIKISSFIQTKPIGITDQPDFTNGAVKIQTNLSIEKLIKLLKGIENRMGRDRSQPAFGPRCIDLDIIVWNEKIMDQDYYSRDFLKKAVDEIS